MAFYNECPVCGCNLDPGEKCDCQDVREEKRNRFMSMVKIGPNGQFVINFDTETLEERLAI